MERKHRGALPQRAGRDGQQQLPGKLRGRREGGPRGVQPGGEETLQVQIAFITDQTFINRRIVVDICEK